MNSTLAAFIQSRPEGYLDREDVRILSGLDPLCPVTVTWHSGAQFTAPARDVPHLVAVMERDEREELQAVYIPAIKRTEARVQRDLERAAEMVQRVIDEAVLFTEPCSPRPVRCAIRGNYGS